MRFIANMIILPEVKRIRTGVHQSMVFPSSLD